MSDELFKSFRRRIFFSALASILITCGAELIVIFNLQVIVEFLRRNGYRNSILGRDGLNPTVQMIILIAAGGAVFLVSFAMCMDSVVRYVREISNGITRIAGGDLNTEISVRGQDEFASIARNLNKMTGEVRVLMDKEREAERTKNDLITNVAHDLRTPLTSVIGYLELLKTRPDLEPEVRQNFVDIAYKKSKRLEKLIEDLFGFTKLNYGKITMKPGMLDIVKLLEQMLDEFYPNFQEAGLTYEFISSQNSLQIEADGNLLARLFDNLINNAIKYGADGKKIVVSVEREDPMVVIRVLNYGKIIPPEELDHIFEKFYRVEHSRSMNTGGTGLGLAIAKGVVELHGGTIHASSSMRGTVFEVRLYQSLKDRPEHFDSCG